MTKPKRWALERMAAHIETGLQAPTGILVDGMVHMTPEQRIAYRAAIEGTVEILRRRAARQRTDEKDTNAQG